MTINADVSTSFSPSGEGISVWINGEHVGTDPWEDFCQEVLVDNDSGLDNPLKFLEIWKNQLTELLVEIRKEIDKISTTRIFFVRASPKDFHKEEALTEAKDRFRTYSSYYEAIMQSGVVAEGTLIYMIIDNEHIPVAQWATQTERWEPMLFTQPDRD